MPKRYNYYQRLPPVSCPPADSPDEVIEADAPVLSPACMGAIPIAMIGSDECAWTYPKDPPPQSRCINYDPYES